MKSLKINLVTAWQWLEKELEERDLTANQQLTLFHLFIKINRNFWKPARVSLNKLAAACNKDKRTVKKAIDDLIELGLIIETEGGYYIGFGNVEQNNRITTQNRQRNGEIESSGNVAARGSADEIDPELAKEFG